MNSNVDFYNIISKCKNIQEYLELLDIQDDITLQHVDAYDSKDWDIRFFKTKHVPEIDTYGFQLKDKDYLADIVFIGPTSKKEIDVLLLVNKFIELYIEGSEGKRVHGGILEEKDLQQVEDTCRVVLTNITTNTEQELKDILWKNGLGGKFQVPRVMGQKQGGKGEWYR